MPFYTDAQLEPIITELATHFEFDLTSVTPVPVVARKAAEIMRDHGMEPSKSLCLMLAKRAHVIWRAHIMKAQQTLADEN